MVLEGLILEGQCCCRLSRHHQLKRGVDKFDRKWRSCPAGYILMEDDLYEDQDLQIVLVSPLNNLW